MTIETIWVFVGDKANFPSGVFPSKDDAAAWIKKHKLSGTLTEYPLGIGVYEWAVENGYFKPKRPDQCTPEFIQRFSDASQEHFHFKQGEEF